MKLDRYPTIGRIAVLTAALSLIAISAKSDINELRVLRDASGLFKGRIFGGTYSVRYDSGFSFSFGGPTMDFAEFARLKDGRSSKIVREDDLEGNNVAKAAGSQNCRTTRGGNRVSLLVTKGVLYEDDGPTKGPWTGGRTSGTLTDRGRAWQANTIASGRQRNGNPPDHTRTVTGRKISAKG